jgi:hypothetical protein
MTTQEVPSIYGPMLAEAEAAVSSLKDPVLRRIAFGRILGKLLREGVSPRASRKRVPSRSRVVPAVRAREVGLGPSRTGPKAYIAELVGEGYFKKQRTIGEVRVELGNRGHHIALTSLSGPLQALTRERRLRRQKATTNGEKGKPIYAYSEW